MKKHLLLLLVAGICLSGLISCEENEDPLYRVVLTPDSTTGKDAVVLSLNQTIDSDLPYMSAAAWTWGSKQGISRMLIEFNIDVIPSYAVVQEAILSLYADSTIQESHYNESGSNACWIQRITSTWTPYDLSWDNQPTTTEVNQVELANTTSENESFPAIDVTDLVQDMVTDRDGSHGFLIKLQEEEIYRRMTFATSENTNADIRPRLVITFEQ